MYRPWRLKNAGKMVLDLGILCLAYFLAFLMRFEGSIPPRYVEVLWGSFFCVLLLQFLCMTLFRVPNLAWRYISLQEALQITLGLGLAGFVLLVGISFQQIAEVILPHGEPPRGILLMDFLLSLTGIVGVRALTRFWFERSQKKLAQDHTDKVPTLFIGAGAAGAEIARKVAAHPEMGILPLGFLDDEADKTGMVIHGLRVLGDLHMLPAVVEAHGIRQTLITMGRPSRDNLVRILELCKQSGIPAKIIPDICDVIEGKMNLSSIREVAIEDLLKRDPVQLDTDAIAGFVYERKIMVTGAGGSIGSELCRTLCRYGPAKLLLVEKSENSLFHIHRELIKDFPELDIIPMVADVCDANRIRQILAEHRPNMVLHAAAHKHVPLMEWNPGEAIKNNIVGTKTLADLAHAYGVNEFVMISTDKAVNPTSIMGVSKRIAEIYIQGLSQKSRTRFVTVRFGNVLGSAGSVIPIFKEQIARGGPVTITHPDMKRYFMTIPEACQLVLQAATMGKGGEIFILDMGQPVRILDLAKDLIRLSGFSPHEIDIEFTGIRPGEKLFEELALKDEIAQKTQHPKIFIGRLKPTNWESIAQHIADLQDLADCPQVGSIMHKFKDIVPEFSPPGVSLPVLPYKPHRPHGILSVNGNGHHLQNGDAHTEPVGVNAHGRLSLQNGDAHEAVGVNGNGHLDHHNGNGAVPILEDLEGAGIVNGKLVT